MKKWEIFESSVRQYASHIWDREAKADRIGGVNFDCIVKLNDREKVVIETTQNNSLTKIREDIAKIKIIKLNHVVDEILIRAYIICDFNPSQGMKDAGEENKIEVISFSDFCKIFFNFETYRTLRSLKQFGSAIDPLTGEKDDTDYTPVNYELPNGDKITAEGIAEKIIKNDKFVLTGDYGSGKSRCLKKVFEILADRAPETLVYPIAIDLKETWGLESAVEILHRHFMRLGISDQETRNIIKAYNGERICFLLDGFDEIGSQPWSEDKKTLESLRKHALLGVKDLISSTKAGCLVSGRNHYFNSDQEMYGALGLIKDKAKIANCKSEFSYDELKKYIEINNIDIQLPQWLPRKPLVLKTISSLPSDQITKIFKSSYSEETEFWFKFIDAMCNRDSKIHPILDPDTVKKVLIGLANLTRTKSSNYGPLTEAEVVEVFREVTKTYPNEQSTVMLQRLPGLGRVNTETSDRNFVDMFILDGLRALNLSERLQSRDPRLGDEKWLNPLQQLGTSVLSKEIKENKLESIFISYTKDSIHKEKTNKISVSDAMSALASIGMECLDYDGIIFEEPEFGYFDFESSNIKNIIFKDGYFDIIKLGKIDPEGVCIKDCEIRNLFGVSSSVGTPPWIEKSCKIEKYESIDTLTAIKNSGLTDAQKILLSILNKIYRQAGNGRLERTLTKGLAQVNKSTLNNILKYLLRNGYLDKSKDKGDIIYKPVRKHQGRIDKIFMELDRSLDEIWMYASSIK